MILMHLALTAIDANEQAQRAADAAWESARWAAGLFILTVILAIGAISAALYAKKTWDAAKRANREREAGNVSAWLQNARGSKDIEVFVRNGNGGPVYDVKCRVTAKRVKEKEPADLVREEPYIALGPEGAQQRSVGYAFNMGSAEYVLGYTDPATGVRYNENGKPTVFFENKDEWKIWDGQTNTGGLAVDLSFRDSAGRYWRRDWHGKLTEVR